MSYCTNFALRIDPSTSPGNPRKWTFDSVEVHWTETGTKMCTMQKTSLTKDSPTVTLSPVVGAAS